MSDGEIAQKGPYMVDVEEGQTYWWCACGRSQTQPFCDGSHNDVEGFEPQEYIADSTTKVFFCGCKRSETKPLCDGTHNSL
jgi:CDGSH-type Zn-finger protein